VLRDIEGLSAPEVAEVLGLGVQAVKSRLHRARLAVRQRIAPLLGSAPPGGSRAPQCPDILTVFSRYLEGEIGPDVCAEMEAHLARCGHCRGRCDSLKRTLQICRTTPVPEVPGPVADAVRRAVRGFLRERAAGRA
jgi:RNA polymerase sigma-70 factor (ECF subfamily)